MIRLHVADLICSQGDTTYCALDHIPAMQRRRLSPLAKLSINSAIEALNGHKADFIVWVSQYGDEHKTLKILEDVLSDQTPSPTQFSTSVHNAISGLYSILCQDSTPATSLAGTWADGLIEAYTWLKTTASARNVLVVYYDEALPEIYMEHQSFSSLAMAALISLESANLVLKSNILTDNPAYEQALAFNNFWKNKEQTEFDMWERC
ncbi:beta-ketoacyl synthase chain length factor [Acinetobacter sp. YH01026]|uniref:beta-ketoacyl synthase chain length factor n=1 Tax=Acinetobacter sp. YH01026 TaxID=2601039 RepID=UPI0015D4423F|nr:beta-ketoacyl synthase chain length factor [Acinetobacter sp. YH01026]